MNKLKYIFLISIFLFSLGFAADNNNLIHQRELYLQARQALQEDKKPYFFYLSKKLKNYPLYPYLVYAELLPRLPERPEAEVSGFLKQYPDTPLSFRLRAEWLQVLAQQQQWNLLLKYTIPNSTDPNIQCLTWQAQLANDQSKQVWQAFPALWLTGDSLPTNCDPIFAVAQQQGILTSDLIWERLQLAFDHKNLVLIHHLTARLPADQAIWVQWWLKANSQPKIILYPPFVDHDNAYSNRIIVDALQTLAIDDAQQAIAAWRTLNRNHHFTDDQEQQVIRAIALDLASEHSPVANDWLKQIQSKYADEKIQSWRVRTALIQSDWANVIYWINQMSAEQGKSAIWRYWLARANEAQGKVTLAQTAYANLAQERSYYGLMASLHLHRPYRVQEMTTPMNVRMLNAVAQISGIQRAGELYAIDMPGLANSEWRFATQKMDQEELYYAAKLAQNWGWTDQALSTAAKAAHQDDLTLRFPLMHQKSVLSAAKQHGVDPAWSYAVIRQESAFSPKAQSGAGALGLMQLLPTTAKTLVPRGKITAQELLNPNTNIQLGCSYLDKILDAYHGNIFLATAAYNAGFGRLRPWIPVKPMPADIWVDTLPWHETRDYVKNVIAYMVIYQQRLNSALITFSAPPTVP